MRMLLQVLQYVQGWILYTNLGARGKLAERGPKASTLQKVDVGLGG